MCLQVAQTGLDYVHDTFEFVRDGETMKLREAMASIQDSFADSYTVRGEGTLSTKLVVPYRRKPYPGKCELEHLEGAALLEQLDKWAKDGTIEPSARDEIKAVATTKGWLDLSKHYFVLLGAGSAMGPYQMLLNHGANIVALDLDRPQIWERLITMARNSPGTITFPIKVKRSEITNDTVLYENAGCNLFTQVRRWGHVQNT